MAELRARPDRDATMLQQTQIRVEADRAERDDDAHARQRGAVAGEHASRTIRAVRRRREADDEEPRARIAEPRDGARPVRLVAKRAALLAADAGAVVAEARAALARHDRVADLRQGVARGFS